MQCGFAIHWDVAGQNMSTQEIRIDVGLYYPVTRFRHEKPCVHLYMQMWSFIDG